MDLAFKTPSPVTAAPVPITAPVLILSSVDIPRFLIGDFLDKFLIIGVIAAVRHILTVGASLTLGSTKDPEAFTRSLLELGVNAGIVVALVLAIYMSKQAHRK